MALCTKRFRAKHTKSFQLSHRTTSSSVYANMPVDVFFHICNYLDRKDICKIGRVCVRWYRLTRSEYVWNRTDIPSLMLSPEKAQQLISSLPQHVEQLKLGTPPGFERQQLRLPTVFHELRERCPQLNILILEDVLLTKACYSYNSMCGYVLNCQVPEKEQTVRYFNELKCVTDEPDTDFQAVYYLPRNLTVLSLRKSVFAVDDIFPSGRAHVPPSKIKVLDATLSRSATDSAILSFCRLPNLEELYLSGTAVTINGVLVILETLHNLKVLDLDSTVVGGETFSVLKQRGQLLTEIYMGNTAIKDTDLTDVNQCTFPNLKSLCLRRTRVTEVGVKRLLDSLQSLTCVIVTGSKVLPGWIVDQRKSLRERLKYDDGEECFECDHFLENKYRGDFKNNHFVKGFNF